MPGCCRLSDIVLALRLVARADDASCWRRAGRLPETRSLHSAPPSDWGPQQDARRVQGCAVLVEEGRLRRTRAWRRCVQWRGRWPVVALGSREATGREAALGVSRLGHRIVVARWGAAVGWMSGSCCAALHSAVSAHMWRGWGCACQRWTSLARVHSVLLVAVTARWLCARGRQWWLIDHAQISCRRLATPASQAMVRESQILQNILKRSACA